MNDYTPLTQKQLERGYFFLTHKVLYRKIAYAISILILVILYISIILGIVNYIKGSDYQSLALNLSNKKDWATYHNQRQPIPLEVSSTAILPLGDKKYNLVAFVENANNNWSITEFDYVFVINNQPIEVGKSFLNPGEKRMVLKVGYESQEVIKNLEVQLDNIKWRRLDDNVPIINWGIRDIEFYPVSRQTVGSDTEEIPAHVNWSAENLSLYHFWDVGFQIVLFSGSKIVGIQEINTSNFVSLEKRDFEVLWLDDLPRISKTEIYPVLNWLDYDNYKDLDIEPSGDSRVVL